MDETQGRNRNMVTALFSGPVHTAWNAMPASAGHPAQIQIVLGDTKLVIFDHEALRAIRTALAEAARTAAMPQVFGRVKDSFGESG